jgi:hypothetical protein
VTDALVGAETLLLVLLLVLVAGLLRSHAEILRRLGPPGQEPVGPAQGPASAPAPVRARAARAARAAADAPAVAGTTLDGDPVRLAFDGDRAQPTLLAFLSSGCASCRSFWGSLGQTELPGGAQPVIVVRGPERESASAVRRLATSQIAVLQSSQAWSDYGVPGSPYFVLVDGAVRGEGVATSVERLVSMLSDAILDGRAQPDLGGVRDRIDERMAAAGVRPGDSSLYPSRAVHR